MNKIVLEAAAQNKLIMGIATQKSGESLFSLPFYSDNRLLFSHPQLLMKIGVEMGRIIQNIEIDGRKIDCIAGAPHVGIPLAWAISFATGLPAVYIQKERKPYLSQKFVQGDFREGDYAVLIDDVMAYGATKDQLMQNAKDDGLLVKHIMVLTNAFPTKNADLIENWKREGLGFDYMFTRDEYFNYLYETGRISKEGHEIHEAYTHDPVGWIDDKKMYQRFLDWKKSVGVKTGEVF